MVSPVKQTDVQGATAFQLQVSVFLCLLKGYTETSSTFSVQFRKENLLKIRLKNCVCLHIESIYCILLWKESIIHVVTSFTIVTGIVKYNYFPLLV